MIEPLEKYLEADAFEAALAPGGRVLRLVLDQFAGISGTFGWPAAESTARAVQGAMAVEAEAWGLRVFRIRRDEFAVPLPDRVDDERAEMVRAVLGEAVKALPLVTVTGGLSRWRT